MDIGLSLCLESSIGEGSSKPLQPPEHGGRVERSQLKQWLHTVGPDCELSIQHGEGPFVSFRGQ